MAERSEHATDTFSSDFTSDAERWAAVAERSRAADGKFFCGVVTTGIYCRPVCSSRQPRRENAVFFDDAKNAQAAGYRACRKCLDPDGLARECAVDQACQLLEAADEAPPTLEGIAEAVGLGPHQLHRAFKRATGLTPRQYWDAKRVARLKANLKSGEAVASAAYGAGYGSSSRLYENADEQLGMSPASFGKGGAGAVIAHASAATRMGLVLVAATAKGVCFVALGDDIAALEDELRGDFPKAELVRDPNGLGEMLDQVAAHLEGREPDLNLPLDVRATAFQRLVWQALRDIPYGETRTYAELAAELGRPKAPRAVGRACASNPVSLLVPCHRAIGSNGSLTGYRWGIERKRDLIAQERATA
jgi:AraC family transcriptional regulator of adaptative response/methylated-DNA-[protein]-cysteine methyltransferase